MDISETKLLERVNVFTLIDGKYIHMNGWSLTG